MQNAAAMVVMGLKKHDHITETRKELHCLCVEARIKFKILTLTWKAVNDMGRAHSLQERLFIDMGSHQTIT